MNQALYAHMNNKRKKKRKKENVSEVSDDGWGHHSLPQAPPVLEVEGILCDRGVLCSVLISPAQSTPVLLPGV
jgi:hypothetical protein